MDVVSLCPLRTASLVWAPRRGTWALTLVVKATYTILPVESPLAREQEYPNEDDNFWNDDAARSLYSPSDLAPFKPRADVVLVGHAFAPRKEPVRSLVARLIVGEVNKAVEVFGERAWTHDGMLREGPRFVKMPLRYERASGGADTHNPVGVRADARPDTFGNVQIPNLQPPGLLLAEPGEHIDSIGFGPIAPAWPERHEKLGRHAGTWQPGNWSEPVPEDIDPGYFMSAPRDQQVEQLRPNERIVLENLHPDHPRLVTSLPGITPQAFVERRGAAQHELSLTCDTLWIDTDRATCTATWRGQLPLEHPQQMGRVLVGMAEPGQRLTWGEIERLAMRADVADEPSRVGSRPRRPPTQDVALTTGEPMRPGANPTLPFIATPEGGFDAFVAAQKAVRPASSHLAPPKAPPPPKKPKPPKPPVEERTADEESTNTGFVRPSNIAALPFGGENTSSGGTPFPPDAPPPTPSRRSPTVESKARVPSATDAPPPAADASPPWLAPAPPRVPAGLLMDHPPGRPDANGAAHGIVGTPAAPPLAGGAFGPPAPPSMGATSAPSEKNGFPPPRPSAPGGDSPWANAPSVDTFSGFGGPPGPPPPPAPPPPPPNVNGFGSPGPSFGGAPPPPPPANGGSFGSSSFGAPPPPPPPIAVPSANGLGNAAAGGVIAASNAAAATNPWGSASPTPPPPAPPPLAIARPAPRTVQREVVELLWFDPESLDRIRMNPPWRLVVQAAKPKPPEEVPFDAELPPDPTPEQKDRRDVVTVMVKIDPHDAEGINEAITDAVTEDGLFEPPLIVLGGELTLPFDELETLKATVTAVTPLIAGDKRLKETVDTVNELLKTPWLQSSTGVAEGLTQRVREAFSQANRILPASYLDTHTERILLEQRNYQKRTMWGAPWIRSLMTPQNGTPVPCYLPEVLSAQLPMFQKFRARVIVEALLQQDENEAQPIALKVIALGRCVNLATSPARRRGVPKLVS